MNHSFDEEKAAQAAAFFVAKCGGKMNYLKLIKLLYLADRESFKNWGRPIVGGPYVAMENGPLSSPLYDAVKAPFNSTSFPVWSSTFKKAGYDLEQLRPVEFDALSKAETGLLESIFRAFGSRDEWELVFYTHEHCREWRDPQGTSIPIPESAIMECVGRTQEEISAVAADAGRHEFRLPGS